MLDFSPNLIAHSEIIGDSSSSEYNNLSLSPVRLANHNSSTNIVSQTIMHALEFFLMMILLPFTTCQRVYENDHLMIMLRVILEVSLELIMWLVLAGVSILTSAALIFDDVYCGKSGSDGYRRLVKNYADETIRRDEFQSPLILENNLSAKYEWPKETVIPSCDTKREPPSLPFPINEVQPPPKKTSKMVSYAPEKDEECVNFSFYKLFPNNVIVESNRKAKK